MDNKRTVSTALEEIKNRVYELEGLLELSRLREDKIKELLPLMQLRIEEIYRMFEPIAELPAGIEEEDATEAVDETIPSNEEEESVAEEIEQEESEGIIEASEESVEDAEEKERIAEDELGTGAKDGLVKPAFCINDRFRFRRELFNNSDKDFSRTMDLVATMESYDEAEEYFISELGWDMENKEVADFMAIIEKYFE